MKRRMSWIVETRTRLLRMALIDIKPVARRKGTVEKYQLA